MGSDIARCIRMYNILAFRNRSVLDERFQIVADGLGKAG